MNEQRLKNNADHISALQSWGPEVRNFRRLSRRPIVEGDCDVVIDKPTYIMKIDASRSSQNLILIFYRILPKTNKIFSFRKKILRPVYVAAVNLYHHFCDFFNLYASLHVNLSHPSTFDTDNHVMIWESYR